MGGEERRGRGVGRRWEGGLVFAVGERGCAGRAGLVRLVGVLSWLCSRLFVPVFAPVFVAPHGGDPRCRLEVGSPRF